MPAARKDGAARRAGGGAPGRSGRKSIPALLGRREAEARGGSRTEREEGTGTGTGSGEELWAPATAGDGGAPRVR